MGEDSDRGAYGCGVEIGRDEGGGVVEYRDRVNERWEPQCDDVCGWEMLRVEREEGDEKEGCVLGRFRSVCSVGYSSV